MKLIHFKTTLTVLFVATCISLSAHKIAIKKEGTFKVDCASVLNVSHKFGELKIVPHNEQTIDIKINIVAEGKVEKDVKKVIDNIDIKMTNPGKMVDIETNIKKTNLSNVSYQINMEIHMPDCIKSNLTNKFGNIIIPDYKGELNINLKFGTLSAGVLSNAKIDLSYSKNSRISEINNIDLKLSFSSLTIDEIVKMSLNSSYSKLNISTAPLIEGSSSFDKISFNEVGTVKLQSKYSAIDISKLVILGHFNSSFGNINVNKIKNGFIRFEAKTSYTGVKLGLEKLEGFDFELKGSYSDISIPFETLYERNGNNITCRANRGGGSHIIVKVDYGSFKIIE